MCVFTRGVDKELAHVRFDFDWDDIYPFEGQCLGVTKVAYFDGFCRIDKSIDQLVQVLSAGHEGDVRERREKGIDIVSKSDFSLIIIEGAQNRSFQSAPLQVFVREWIHLSLHFMDLKKGLLGLRVDGGRSFLQYPGQG